MTSVTSTRLKLAQEGQLWKSALAHFGPTGLQGVVIERWLAARAPARPTVEYLDSTYVGNDVLNILRVAQIAAGAAVPYRAIESKQIAIYSAHAEHLANELLKIMPVRKLLPSLKGARLELDLGI